MKRTLAVLTGVLVALGGSAKTKGLDPLTLLKSKYKEMRGVIRKWGKDEHKMREELRKVMDTFVDFEELSKRTLPGTWDKLKKQQREEFVREFKKMIQRTYISKFHADQKFSIEYNGRVKYNKGKKQAYVSTTIRAGKSEAKVDYALYKRKGRWWAYDVIIDDISLMKKYRRQFVRIVKRDGFETLLEKIKRRNKKREQEEQEEEQAKDSETEEHQPDKGE